MKRNKQSGNGLIVLLIIVAFFAAVGTFIGSPYLKSFELKRAFSLGDAQYVIASTDFDSLRDSLKNQKTPSMGALSANERILKKAAEYLESPEKVEELVKLSSSGYSRFEQNVTITEGFDSLDLFAIQINYEGYFLKILLRREGFSTWKISAVSLS